MWRRCTTQSFSYILRPPQRTLDLQASSSSGYPVCIIAPQCGVRSLSAREWFDGVHRCARCSQERN